MLARLRQADPDSKYHCLTLYRSFTHRNHLCLVFESLRLVELQVTVKGGGGGGGLIFLPCTCFFRKVGMTHRDILRKVLSFNSRLENVNTYTRAPSLLNSS